MGANATRATWLKSFDQVRNAASAIDEWHALLGGPGSDLPACGIHLAVFIEPFLGYVLDGSKTVEGRFSATRCAPFGKVRQGDIVLLKRAGGPIVGIARISSVSSYNLDKASWRWIRQQFSESLRAQDPEFWEARIEPAYATLMTIDRVLRLDPVEWEKKDRRGWVVMRRERQLLLFGGDDES